MPGFIRELSFSQVLTMPLQANLNRLFQNLRGSGEEQKMKIENSLVGEGGNFVSDLKSRNTLVTGIF
jgi:hypothetical protein